MNVHDVIIRPVLTEKTSGKSEKERKYSFQINKNANKIQVKEAVEELFKVKVLKVNTVMMRGKKRRVRYRIGKTPDWKKAFVTLKEGDKIEFA